MAGYNHPCRYCNSMIPPDSSVCPVCGKKSPLSIRCPKCRSPVKKGWKACSCCGLKLEIVCPKCGETTFFDNYCEHCEAPLTTICPNPKCKTEQPILGDTCIKCGKPLSRKK